MNAPRVFVPTLANSPQLLQDWYWKELRSGYLFNYLLREKAQSRSRLRAVAQRHYGRKQNPKSDLRQLARIPAREYFRWKAQDEHFWDDDNNLRSFRRDNPEALIHVDPRQLPRGRFKKVYAAKAESGKRKAETPC